MFRNMKGVLVVTASLAGAVAFVSDGQAAAGEEGFDVVAGQDQEAIAWANEFAREVTQVMEGWISSGALTEERLLAALYYPIPNTSPYKYSTDYDALADRDFAAIQEKYFSKDATVIYAVVADRNGYVPTHNRQYSQPLTGNRAVDLVNNRTKRLFGDITGFNAGRSEAAFLVQRYKRDTGEQIVDVSVPVFVRRKHFGCVRIGYRAVSKLRP